MKPDGLCFSFTSTTSFLISCSSYDSSCTDIMPGLIRGEEASGPPAVAGTQEVEIAASVVGPRCEISAVENSKKFKDKFLWLNFPVSSDVEEASLSLLPVCCLQQSRSSCQRCGFDSRAGRWRSFPRLAHLIMFTPAPGRPLPSELDFLQPWPGALCQCV